LEPSVENILKESNNPSALCMKCGLCCFTLSARVTEEEADLITRENDMKKDSFVVIEKEGEGPNAGNLVIKLPCKFLSGKPLHFVLCRIHGKFRPKVCTSYLCKIATQYKIGTISFKEALFRIRLAFVTGDRSIFNWTNNEKESNLIVASFINDMAKILKASGLDEDEIKEKVMDKMTPKYKIATGHDNLLLSMHLASFDKNEDQAYVFFGEEIDKWNPEKLEIVRETAKKIMGDIRMCFDLEIDPEQNGSKTVQS
jgi:Fe-S-cluster containining protein